MCYCEFVTINVSCFSCFYLIFLWFLILCLIIFVLPPLIGFYLQMCCGEILYRHLVHRDDFHFFHFLYRIGRRYDI